MSNIKELTVDIVYRTAAEFDLLINCPSCYDVYSFTGDKTFLYNFFVEDAAVSQGLI